VSGSSTWNGLACPFRNGVVVFRASIRWAAIDDWQKDLEEDGCLMLMLMLMPMTMNANKKDDAYSLIIF
jgi:hypothetical protein